MEYDMDGLNGNHEQYFIRYQDKDSEWDEMYLYLSEDDWGRYVEEADKMREYGHRNVVVMETVTIDRVVY